MTLMIKASIFEAKTNLSEFLKKVQSGTEVVITAGREKTPIARLEAIQPIARKRLGVLEPPGFSFTPAFYEPLPEDELRLWNGEGA
jgi:antitoxin (DNA-binding transcriptional repressor) of toxin-antitoxin stability system